MTAYHGDWSHVISTDIPLDRLAAFPHAVGRVVQGERWPGIRSKLEEPQGTRGSIYGYVRMHPGTHVREISRELSLGMGDVQYHLYVLEKQGRIKTLRRGHYKFVFAIEIFSERRSIILSILTQETPRDLLLRLIEMPNSSQHDLAEFTNLSVPTINWHMKRLVDQGIVARERRGKTIAYNVTGPIRELEGFLRNYHPNIWQKWSSRLVDIFLVLSEREEEEETR